MSTENLTENECMFLWLIVGGFGLCAVLFFGQLFLDIIFGEFCWGCKNRSREWVMWHQKEGETDYEGYQWCPKCGHKKYSGFEDRPML
ncbi:MAG: hypothetical protein FVQ80_11355 [Planctomycetes bacterium]|nr:hypothetical protein [Planctomycetota bacterium]